MQNTECIELFHGTRSFDASRIINTGNSLVGLRYIKYPPHSGNLTTNISVAEAMARNNPLRNGERYVVMRYRLPRGCVIDEGPISGGVVHGFSTIFQINPEEVPQEYFTNLAQSPDELRRGVETGRISLFRVPNEYFEELCKLES